MKALIWDFDGTLAYREGLWSGALLEILQKVHPEFQVSRKKIATHLKSGFPWHSPETPHLHIKKSDQWWKQLNPLFEKVFLELGLKPEEAAKLSGCVREVFTDPNSWQLFGDTVPVLKLLKSQGWNHFLLTNHVPELRDICKHLGLDCFITAIFNSAETGYEKPHPQAFLNILNSLPKHSNIWMIGDNLKADILGAQSLKIPTILVRKYNPTSGFFCEDLAAIPSLLYRTS